MLQRLADAVIRARQQSCSRERRGACRGCAELVRAQAPRRLGRCPTLSTKADSLCLEGGGLSAFVSARADRSRKANRQGLEGVRQPLQLGPQRSLGKRQQVGRREISPARRAPLVVIARQPLVFVARQLEIQELVAERQHGGALNEAKRQSAMSRNFGDLCDRSDDPGGDMKSKILLTRRRSSTRFSMSRPPPLVNSILSSRSVRFEVRATTNDFECALFSTVTIRLDM